MTPDDFRDARKTLGLTQAQLSALLGYHAKTRVSAIETGQARPGAAVCLLLQAYLDGYRPALWPGRDA